MYKVYGIPNCDTVKKSLNYLSQKGIEFEFHNYKKQSISIEKLTDWFSQIHWEEIVNKKGTTWKQIPKEELPNNEHEAILTILKNTSVVKRPIVEKEGKIVAIGFDVTQFDSLK